MMREFVDEIQLSLFLLLPTFDGKYTLNIKIDDISTSIVATRNNNVLVHNFEVKTKLKSFTLNDKFLLCELDEQLVLSTFVKFMIELIGKKQHFLQEYGSIKKTRFGYKINGKEISYEVDDINAEINTIVNISTTFYNSNVNILATNILNIEQLY